MIIKKYKFQEGDVLPKSPSSETEESVTEKVNEFNDKWFNSKRQNIGLNAFYNKQADEYNENFNQYGWSKERGDYEKPFVPIVKSPKGNIDEVGEIIKAPGDSRLLTPNPRYVKSILGKAKSNLSDFNKNITDTKVDFDEINGAIGYYQRKNNNTVKVDSRISDEDKLNTAIHESAHRLAGYDNTKTGWNKNQYNSEYFVDSAEGDDLYYDSKDEQYARTHQARQALNLDPNTVYTEDEIQHRIDNYNPGSIHKKVTLQDNLFNRYSISDLTNMFNNSFKKGGIVKAESGTSLSSTTSSNLSLPKLSPITTKASPISTPGIIRPQDSNRRYLNIYENAKKEGRLFEGNEGDRFGMRFLGERPLGFSINKDTVQDISRHPILSKKLGITNNSTPEDAEKALHLASDPNSSNHSSYIKLDRKLDVVKNNGIPAPSMRGRVEVGKRIEEAQDASDFLDQRYKSRGVSGLAKNIRFSDYDSLVDSGRSLDGEIHIGISPENKVKYGRRYLTTVGGTVAHEGGHGDPVYNTNMNDTDNVYSDKQIKQIFKDSPAYGNIYSNIPDEERRLLSYKWWKFPNKHNRELSEGYSDLLETQQNMRELGISDAAATGGIYTEDDVRKYLNTDLGRGDRFVRLRGGKRGRWFDKMLEALNTVGLD